MVRDFIIEKEELQKWWKLFQKPTLDELSQFDEVFIYKDTSEHPNSDLSS